MNLETANTVFSQFDELSTPLLGPRFQLGSATTNLMRLPWADQFLETQGGFAHIPGQVIELSIPRDPALGMRGAFSLGTAGTSLNLIDVRSGQGLLGYRVLANETLLEKSRNIVFKYILPGPSTTGLWGNSVMDRLKSPTPISHFRPRCDLVWHAHGILTSTAERTIIAADTHIELRDPLKGILTPEVEKIISSGDLVEFEDGMENEFTHQLIRLVKKYGEPAVKRFSAILSRPGVRPEVVAQTLLCFGRIDDQRSYLARSRAVRQGLLSPSVKVRDAAAEAIASMRDIGARADLTTAVQKEVIPSLKKDMETILVYLQK